MVSRLLIETLFSGSHSVAAYPLRVVYDTRERQPGEPPVQVLVSVSKRRFRHAVDRNRVKRQIREAYRLHKAVLSADTRLSTPDGVQRQLLLAFVWQSDRHLPTADIAQRVERLLQRIAEKI